MYKKKQTLTNFFPFCCQMSVFVVVLQQNSGPHKRKICIIFGVYDADYEKPDAGYLFVVWAKIVNV